MKPCRLCVVCRVTSWAAHVQSTWLVLWGRFSFLSTEAFESSFGERNVSFPFYARGAPRCTLWNAWYSYLIYFYSLSSVKPLATAAAQGIQLLCFFPTPPPLHDNKQGHVLWGWKFSVFHLPPPPPTRQTFYTSLGPNIHAFRRIVELHLVLCFYYLTARQLLLQPSSVTPSPSPFGVALSYVSGGYLQDVSIYNELRVISVHPLKKKRSHFTQCFRSFFGARNARDSKQGYWRHFSQTHQMGLHPESDHFQIIVWSVSPSHRFASVFLLCVMTCLTAERLLRVSFVQS